MTQKLRPSLLATICLVQLLQMIVVLMMLAIAWNGGYWKGRDTGFTDMYNASRASMIIRPKDKGRYLNPADDFRTPTPPKGWVEVPTKNGEKLSE